MRTSNDVSVGRVAGAALATVGLVLAAGCGRRDPLPQFPPPQVTIVVVAPQRMPEVYEFPAEVEPYRRVDVRARVEGVIVARPFTEGAIVSPGQVLYRLDPVRYEAAYRSAVARNENAKQTLARLEPLVAQNAVAQQDVDNARSEYAAAQATLDQAKKDLDDTEVRAEIEGRVGRTRLDAGARVTGPGDLLTTIDRIDPVYVTFRPSSEQLLVWQQDPPSRALARPGSALQVQVVLPDGATLPRAGRLDFVAPSLDSATGTQEFRAVFQNPDRLLLPGQFVRVRLIGFARDSALAIPQRAVQTGLGRQFVYVVGPGDTVAARDVQSGPWSGDRWIIEKGLAPGDRVIVDGVQKVAPGRPVRPEPLGDTAVTRVPATSSGATR
ncbi:MAG TPA: efflux RND transporter periplasmic adaptor subunit [Gemmatimonadales bacterium]|nr:efflux RND transporter periplasmic adaptor subunit [Gemmatimonadales bacterium]